METRFLLINRNLWLILVLLFAWTAGLSANPIQGPGGNYWALFCKTGPIAKAEIDSQKSFRIFFESTGKPAGNNFENLTPGTCSWPDRAMRKDELQGYYGEMFAQWECPALLACLTPVYDSAKHDYVPPIPFFKDPAGKKFVIWVRKDSKFMRIFGSTSPKIEFR